MFPWYLSLGMTYYDYWCREPYLVRAYDRANEINIQRKNQEMYMQGLYNFHAVGTALSNLNFSGKPRRPNSYLKEPFNLTPLTDEGKKAEAEKEQKKIIENLTAWANANKRKEVHNG